jgi:hypothetical protein
VRKILDTTKGQNTAGKLTLMLEEKTVRTSNPSRSIC